MARQDFPRFPPLPPAVARQIDLIMAEGDEDADEELQNAEPDTDKDTGEVLKRRVRPWELDTLARVGGDLEWQTWRWLDDVVLWHNTVHAGRDEQVIPHCWQLHGGLANDLAATMFARLDAYDTVVPSYVTRWHADLEDFHRRMESALGLEGGKRCRRGEHEILSKRTVRAVESRIKKERKEQGFEE